MAEGLRRAPGTRPPTHQGPRPRLGMVAGVMMPLTSCWMILEQQGRAAVSTPRTGAIPGGRTGTGSPASRATAWQGWAQTPDPQREGPRAAPRSRVLGQVPPRPGEHPHAHHHVQSPLCDQGTVPEIGRGTGSVQCPVQLGGTWGPSPPLRTRRGPLGASSFCPVLPGTQEGPGSTTRQGCPLTTTTGPGPKVDQAHPRQQDPAQNDGGHSVDVGPPDTAQILGPHSGAPHSLGRTGLQTPAHPILHSGLGWLC